MLTCTLIIIMKRKKMARLPPCDRELKLSSGMRTHKRMQKMLTHQHQCKLEAKWRAAVLTAGVTVTKTNTKP